MPKKRTAKDRARYYTTVQQSRVPRRAGPSDALKDVTTQLHELRIEQARERPRSTPLPLETILHKDMVLGFTPANYAPVDAPPETLEPRWATRRVPGPAPPRSWTLSPQSRLRRVSISLLVRSRMQPVPPFPGLETPDPRSLVHHCLLALGTYFYDHQVFNQYYLPELNLPMKQWLLTYIAALNIGGAITRESLDVIFPWKRKESDPEEMEDIITLSREDEADLRFLDLGDFLSSNKSPTEEDEIIRDLRNFLSPLYLSNRSVDESDCNHLIRFPNLTHLALDLSPPHNPKFNRSKLVKVLCKHCPRLTHLSLAGVFTSSATSSALIYLSRNLLCLEYVDLSRNPALHERYGNPYLSVWDATPQPFVNAPGGRLLERLSWEGAWLTVRTLVIKRCGFTKDMEDDIRTGIVNKRSGHGSIRIITS